MQLLQPGVGLGLARNVTYSGVGRSVETALAQIVQLGGASCELLIAGLHA